MGDEIQCPHCGHSASFEMDATMLPNDDEWNIEFTCPDCGRDVTDHLNSAGLGAMDDAE
jgi:predicted RNA-binding Zn-ribbon protein involved in translation (DUF1610 family)